MNYLKNSGMDEIGVEGDSIPVFPLPSHVGFLLKKFCSHPETAPFVRIDHRAGPGCFADSYRGKGCLDCGGILHEVKL